MNKIFYFIFSIVMLSLFSCNSKKNEAESYLRPAAIEYSKQDTIDINDEVNQYVEKLKNLDFDGCADMLHVVSGQSLLPLSDEQRHAFVQAMNAISIVDVTCKAMVLRDSLNNQYQLAVTMEGNPDDEPRITYFYLNPILRDGSWYLTLLDENAEGVEKVY